VYTPVLAIVMNLRLLFAALTLASGIAHAADGNPGVASSNGPKASSANTSAHPGKHDKCDTNDAKCASTGNTSGDFSTGTQWSEPETYALVLGGVGVLLLLGTRRRREG